MARSIHHPPSRPLQVESLLLLSKNGCIVRRPSSRTWLAPSRPSVRSPVAWRRLASRAEIQYRPFLALTFTSTFTSPRALPSPPCSFGLAASSSPPPNSFSPTQTLFLLAEEEKEEGVGRTVTAEWTDPDKCADEASTKRSAQVTVASSLFEYVLQGVRQSTTILTPHLFPAFLEISGSYLVCSKYRWLGLITCTYFGVWCSNSYEQTGLSYTDLENALFFTSAKFLWKI